MIKTNKKITYYKVTTDRMDNNTKNSIIKGDIIQCIECFNVNEVYNKDCFILLKGSISLLANIVQLSNKTIELQYRNEAYKPKKVLISNIEKLYLVNSITRNRTL